MRFFLLWPFAVSFRKTALNYDFIWIFSSPGRSPGRAIVLPPASALELASAFAAASALGKC